jgi:integrase/recombinase XerD
MLRPKRIVPRREAEPDESSGNPLHAIVSRFLDWTLAVGLAQQTAKLRQAALDRLVQWCHARGLSRAREITREVLEQYQLHLARHRKSNGEPLALATQVTRLHPVRAFCSWMVHERLLDSDPSSDLRLPRLPRRLPRWVPSIRQIDCILAQPDTSKPAGIRDRAILEVLYSTGLRRMELVRLTAVDVDLVAGLVRVRGGKGGRDRVVPLGCGAASWLASYLRDVRPMLVESRSQTTVFVTDYGEPFAKNRLGDLVRRYIDRSGIAAPGACHVFRHACATHMLENGADIRFIQSMLGHADLSTTQIYTRVSIGKLAAVHAATHPSCQRPHEHALRR